MLMQLAWFDDEQSEGPVRRIAWSLRQSESAATPSDVPARPFMALRDPSARHRAEPADTIRR